MKFTVRQPIVNADGSVTLKEVRIEDIVVNNYAILSIDGSTTNSGLAIMRESDGALMYTMKATRDASGETPVHYKVRLKRTVYDILVRNKFIKQVYYEEPVVANIASVANLFMLRTFIEELIIENEPELDYIKHYEISNMRWKKEFLAPDKVPQGTEKQKAAVREKMEKYLPFLSAVTQDEIDAICMGFVVSQYTSKNQDAGEELQSKKKHRPFQYNIEFIGANEDDGMLDSFCGAYTGPKKLIENGIKFTEIVGKTNFNKHIYEQMGDDDKIIVVKFPSKTHGDLILEHRVGYLSAQYEYMYAIVWRKTRK